jgi:hypothetical protein
MDEDECLRRFGLTPGPDDLPAIRRLLVARTASEAASQGDGDTLLMKLLCVQLFNVGLVQDALLVWRAKRSSFDAMCSIDVQLLCGAGLPETRAFLMLGDSDEARGALRYLDECIAAGEFEEFSVARRASFHSAYYAAGDEDGGE